MALVLAGLCVLGALLLIAQTVVQRRIWKRHRQQIHTVRGWREKNAAAPYDQLGSGPPDVTSPYAVHDRPLPPRPGDGRLLWAGVLIAVAALLVVQHLA